MVKYLSFRDSSFALRYLFKCKWQGPQCDTHLVGVMIVDFKDLLFNCTHWSEFESNNTCLPIFKTLKFPSIKFAPILGMNLQYDNFLVLGWLL
jgi:hypothetical protein